jgi:hypothetical protein
MVRGISVTTSKRTWQLFLIAAAAPVSAMAVWIPWLIVPGILKTVVREVVKAVAAS